MNVIKLPGILPGNLDLSVVNQQLRDGSTYLDWSSVSSITESQLEILLAGIPAESDAIGNLDEASDVVTSVVGHYLANRPSLPPASSPSLIPDPRPLAPFLPTPFAIRAELEDILFRDLLGPAGGEAEEMNERSVHERYLVGMLAPRFRKYQPELAMEEDLEIAGVDSPQEGKPEAAAPPTDSMLPSSMGLTFSVNESAKSIRVQARWGRYDRIRSEERFKEDGSPELIWKRTQVDQHSAPIRLKEGMLTEWTPLADFPDVVVQGIARKQPTGWIISIFLVNGQHEPDQLGDRTWIFQPQLILESGDEPGSPVFTRRGHSGFSESGFTPTDEAQMVRMAYRSQVEFAVGHNVGVHWECLPDDPQRATRVMTAVVPRYEVPKTTPPTVEEIPALQGLELDMKVLAELSGTELVKRLAPVTEAYSQWIHDQATRIDDPAANLEEFRETARLALENCSRALTRIQEGINLLQTDPVAAEAFRFANQAMYRQRVHSLYAERKRQGKEVTLSEMDIPANHRWFPFQMAFILLNLPGLTQFDHPDRTGEAQATADLLWFPTGGGKTEAYLGLTAYVLGLRRLQGEIEGRTGDYGVAVLMRYTLRLLTLQQFQRASALICACESIRREAIEAKNTQWGQEPFRIGLWVGQKTTPNHTEDSKAYVDRSQFQPGQSSSSTPHQLTNCPWCGEKINPGKDIKVEPYPNGRARTFIFCGDNLGRCLFSSRRSPDEGIPILVVDEEIYRRLPALLIATVDKFAQMPWEGRTQMLFGQVDSYCPRHGFRSPEVNDSSLHPAKGGMPTVKSVPVRPLRPPDLIIQDELHLISGPLGTLVGLYETAVDRLASWEVKGKRVYPKVVASTATIRQAREQVHGVFLRQVQIFPPQGLDAADNFFSRQRPPGETTPGRVYLGFCAPGKRLKIALIRTYIALLAGSQYLYEKYGSQADPWMTLVGYFNSVRELAGMRRVTDDDVVSRLKRMDRRGLAKRLKLAVEELTSRRTSTEIPMILDRLETVFDPQRRKENEARRKIGQPPIGSEPIDVLLATNMISVGVDVKRLGVLVTAGQPKTTAEYIQATSRVGRSFPGLVVTVYNWARPRDLSHYEKFEQYHATFYEHVEALSVTPFATGAIKRGLSALLVSLIRLAGQELNANEQAFRIERHHPSVQTAIETIIQRAWAVGGAQVRDQVEREIAAKLDFWLDQARVRAGGVQLAYEDTRDGVSKGLLRDPSGLQWEEFTTLRSLRNVEPTINLVLDDRQLEADLDRFPDAITTAVEGDPTL